MKHLVWTALTLCLCSSPAWSQASGGMIEFTGDSSLTGGVDVIVLGRLTGYRIGEPHRSGPGQNGTTTHEALGKAKLAVEDVVLGEADEALTIYFESRWHAYGPRRTAPLINAAVNDVLSAEEGIEGFWLLKRVKGRWVLSGLLSLRYLRMSVMTESGAVGVTAEAAQAVPREQALAHGRAWIDEDRAEVAQRRQGR